MTSLQLVVVPYLFLVWYNYYVIIDNCCVVVVPYLFLVWYNRPHSGNERLSVVVPYLFLVWYNKVDISDLKKNVVVPYLFLVWYNREAKIPMNSMVYRDFCMEKTLCFVDLIINRSIF